MVLILAAALAARLAFLLLNCPLDLTGDEAHYWDWSRQLDLSYYSKGPLVAYLIRASCAVFGDTMPAVRLPAVLLALATSLCTWWLALRVFGSRGVALGAVALSHVIPLLAAGGILMTIDPPYYFAWAMATCLAAAAVLDGRKWAWPCIGLLVGLGFLAKYAMLLWLVMFGLFLLLDRNSRRTLRTGWPYLSAGIALLGLVPVLLWNARHGWVSLAHVSTQTGGGAKVTLEHLPAFVLGQVGVLTPLVFLTMVGAVVWAVGQARHGRTADARLPAPIGDERRRGIKLLLWMAVPFWLLVVVDSLKAKTQANWAAPAYFTLVILSAFFLAERLSGRRAVVWRGWTWAMALTGLAAVAYLHAAEPLYPLMNKAGLAPRDFDPTVKFKGYAEFGRHLSQRLQQMPPGAFVLAQEYQKASALAFYLEGQPRTYCVGSYFKQLTDRKRRTQFDLWPDRKLDSPELLGRDALYVGHVTEGIGADLRQAFATIERQPDYEIVRRGVKIGVFRVWLCRQFRGMRHPPGPQAH
jgi:undecaprenyl-diphosphatase